MQRIFIFFLLCCLFLTSSLLAINDNTPVPSSAPYCSDSDGGVYSSIKGVLSSGAMKYTDTCLSSTRVSEYFCNWTQATYPVKDVVYLNCQVSYACSDGACIPKCRDSDANATYPDGKNYYKQGFADGRISGIGSYYNDTCLFKNQTGPSSWTYVRVASCNGANCNLQEGFCASGNVSNAAYSCPNGCAYGVCLPLAENFSISIATTKQGFFANEPITLTDPPDAAVTDEVSETVASYSQQSSFLERLKPLLKISFAASVVRIIGRVSSAPLGNEEYEIQLSLPAYFSDYLRRPQKIVAGRTIEIVKKKTFPTKSNAPSSVTIYKKHKLTKRKLAFSEKSLTVSKQTNTSFMIDIPNDLESGSYTIEFQHDGKSKSLPLEVEGIASKKQESSLTGSVIATPEQQRITTVHLYDSNNDCHNCYWESVLGVDPNNGNISYFVTGTTRIAFSTDGWKTHVLSDLMWIRYLSGSSLDFIGDPKLAFGVNNTLIISGLVYNRSKTIGGVNIVESPPKNKRYSKDFFGTSNFWLDKPVFLPPMDYPKVSADRNLLSKYFGNIYFFAQLVPREISPTGEAVFVYYGGGVFATNLSWHTITSTVVGKQGEVYAVSRSGWSEDVERAHPILLVSYDGGKKFIERQMLYYKSDCSSARTSSWFIPARTSSNSNRAWLAYIGPELAIDMHTGRLYASWADYEKCVDDETFEYGSYAIDRDIFVSYSDDDGVTWSNPLKVNDDNSGGDQAYPSLFTDKNGDLYVAFFDHRAQQDKAQFDVYLSKSSDGGKTFSQNLKVNEASIPNVIGGRQPGDYFDLVAAGDSEIFVGYPCVHSWQAGASSDVRPTDTCISIIPKSILFSHWPPQSKLVNHGTSSIRGTLNIFLQRLSSDGQWTTMNDKSLLNYPIILKSQEIVKLDAIFNPLLISLPFGGTYRVRAEFASERGTRAEAAWEFKVFS